MLRWGNPDKAKFRFLPFGGLIEESGTFDGNTIPTKVRVGWYFGSERFDSEGKSKRST
ncbi:hypothetical protein [Edaphobacter aggregans]|uniref:hypothetical protein n=1 Tax=Edaphobacter aggregans TaxID=570835 RepID=UPI0012F7DE90|nr:hypothetical protein [Edaphobacter aggregans]